MKRVPLGKVLGTFAVEKSYRYFFATRDTHAKITTMKHLKKSGWNHSFGFFLNSEEIGSADLTIMRDCSVHTDNVALFRAYRRKGHGIHLYSALISCAASLGAKRIYSDTSLNRFSRKMWEIKLVKAGFQVKKKVLCKESCRHCTCKERFYIDL